MTDHDKPMSMVERVARAMYPGLYEMSISDTDAIGEQNIEVAKNRALRQARAAISAMREPTEGMMKAGIEAHAKADDSGIDDKPWMPDTLPSTYRAMIDAALKEDA